MKEQVKRLSIVFLGALLLLNCSGINSQQENQNIWSNAKWIGYEQLSDSLKVVPAMHGSGNNLGNKAVKRSVVPMFRKEFQIDDDIESAVIHISGLGHYELHINGEKIGDRFLAPGWSDYRKRCFYNSYDITENLKSGANALGVLVGNGFFNVNRERYRKLVVAYGHPRLIFNIQIKLKNGTSTHIVSDEQCKVTPSPITFSSIYGGEDYDARMEQSGWDKAPFDDSQWQNSIELTDSIGILIPEEDHPLKIMQEFPTQKTFKSGTGKIIYDFGQNASGIISLRVKGNKGAQIRIFPDELVNEDGFITQRSGGGPYEFNYTLKGDGIEFWMPKFTYYGFRYAEVEIIEPDNVKQGTEIIEMKMLHTRNSSPEVGSFSCSDSLFNQIYELIKWGIKSNMASVATDCPHREKLGWLEQTYLIGPSMHYNFDIHLLYSKIVQDMIDSQLDNGLVPDIAPEYVPFEGGFRDSPEWGSASVIIPWQMYHWYGDKAILEKAYPMMKKYVAYLESKSQDHILDYGLGDWYDLGPDRPGRAQLTPVALTATAIYYHDLMIILKIAEVMDFTQDVETYKTMAENVRKAFLDKFYDAQTGVVSTGSQTAYAMTLYVGIIQEGEYERVFKNLVNSIEENDYALTSGDIGYHFLVRVLSENGRSDILYKMNNRSDRPGYGYQLKKGATSLTESWAALPEHSNNHMMLGHLMEWFYNGLGGIYQDKSSLAYKNIIIAPKPVGNIQWAKCSYNSVKGIISSSWKMDANGFIMTVAIPEYSNAKIIIPEKYREFGLKVKNLGTGEMVKISTDNGTFNLPSGKFEIDAK